MPIYEYQCNCCNLRFELRRGFGDGAKVSCPRCQGDSRLLFFPVPIVFKGPGFYVTDNAGGEKNKPRNKAKREKEEGKDEEKAKVV